MKQWIQLKCQRCNKDFSVTPSAASAKFCSKACGKPSVIKQCIFCRKDYKIGLVASRLRKYCSAVCKKSFEESIRKSKDCEVCGKIYKPFTYRFETSKFCSTVCKRTENKRPEKSCENCGKVFKPYDVKTRPNQIFCSKECRDTKEGRKVDIACLFCGKVFKHILSKGGNTKFCSKNCYTNEQLKHVVNSKHLSWQRRREKLIKEAGGRYTQRQWKEKLTYFGNCCYLCGKSLESKKLHKDHRIPLSRGGKNWIANIAPTCVSCNLSKGNKTEKEFREFQATV